MDDSIRPEIASGDDEDGPLSEAPPPTHSSGPSDEDRARAARAIAKAKAAKDGDEPVPGNAAGYSPTAAAQGVGQPEVLEPAPACAIPPHILRMARLTPEYLPPDGDLLLMHVQSAVEDLKPATAQAWLDCIRVGRANYAVANGHAFRDGVRRVRRRTTVRELMKPGWLTTAGSPPAPSTTIMREDRNTAEGLPLELGRYEYDENLEEALAEKLNEAGLPAELIIASETYRRGLDEEAKITALLTNEEARLDNLLRAYRENNALQASHRVTSK